MQITEPVTMLTDYALGAVNLFFTISILTKLHSRNRVSGILILLGFLSQTIAGFAGGTYHGFALELSSPALRSVWNLTVLTIGASIAFLMSGVHAADVHKENGNWIVAAVAIGVLGYGIQLTGFRSHQNFNHNDLFHVIQIAAMFLFFRGASRLEDRPYSPR
jgi:ABC-type multidrug transport system permease subunit